MKKFVIYTAIFGKPGRFTFPRVSVSDEDKFCFTDLNIKPGIGQMIPVRKERFILNNVYEMKKIKLNHLSPVRANRQVKICIPDEIFDNYEYSIYIDCKRPAEIDLDYSMSCLESDSDFLVRQHRSKRDCIYGEGQLCIEKKKDTEINIMKQLNFYRSEKYPAHNGLYEGGWIFRRHTKKLK